MLPHRHHPYRPESRLWVERRLHRGARRRAGRATTAGPADRGTSCSVWYGRARAETSATAPAAAGTRQPHRRPGQCRRAPPARQGRLEHRVHSALAAGASPACPAKSPGGPGSASERMRAAVATAVVSCGGGRARMRRARAAHDFDVDDLVAPGTAPPAAPATHAHQLLAKARQV